jgi:hypothetical protein
MKQAPTLPIPDAVQQLIAARAYEIWENQGRPVGHHILHWQQAEQDILGSLPAAFGTMDAGETPKVIHTSA